MHCNVYIVLLWCFRHLPAMQETQVQSLGWEDLLEKEMAIHSSILCLGISRDSEAWQATVHGVAKSWIYTQSAYIIICQS